MLAIRLLRRDFTKRSARDYVPQIDKIKRFNTPNYELNQRPSKVHPDTRAKQLEVS